MTIFINQTGSGTATASSSYTGVPVTNAFDGNLGTVWGNSSSMPSWLQYDFGSGIIINSYRIYFATTVAGWNDYNYSPNNFQFQGSNDATNWTNLDTRTGQGWSADGWKEYQFSNSTAYRYYRLYITTSKNSPWSSIAELQLCVAYDWITPKTDWAPTDYFNASDLNRLENNILVLRAYLISIQYAIATMTTITNRDQTYIEFLSGINRIEQNIETIKTAFMVPSGYLPAKTWTSTPRAGFDYTDANRLENNVKLMYELALLLANQARYCGTQTCGELGLIW